MSYLPISKTDMISRGWDQVDYVIVTGDAYVDHPSFGTAIISRIIESCGYKVGIVSQPNVNSDKDISVFGKPKYAFLVNAGNLDSMVAHYTAAKKKRSDDMYTPGGVSGKRPDRAVTVYSKLIKKYYPDTPVIIGGVEASLRRFAHYDYWENEVMPSVLIDSGADYLSYGMGEKQTVEICKAFGENRAHEIKNIDGICYLSDEIINDDNTQILPSYEDVCASKKNYAIACRIEYDEQDAYFGKRLVQKHGDRYLIQNKPMKPLTTDELDWVYSLPYERYYHPSYEEKGGVPAIKEVEFSITHNRGCFGACNFCAIAYHQGRTITSRSKNSVVEEAKLLTKNPHFKGYIHDVGGPTANFRFPSCEKQLKSGLCKGKKCLAPTPCKNLSVDHSEYLDILREIRELSKVKKVFIRSGIRFDYLLEDKNDEFFKELVTHHVSGQLKVAPEHCSAAVLDKMGKPHIEAYKRFSKKFFDYTKKIGKEQYLVPYLMSSHPGSDIKDAIELALFLKKERVHPEQVQDFYPTPGSISTCMYYTDLDPYTLKPVFTPKTEQEKAMQRALLQWFKPENRQIVEKALRIAGRTDLIGFGEHCLIKPLSNSKSSHNSKSAPKKKIVAKGRWDPKKRK